MLRILSGLREVRICILEHRILVSMPKLFLQSNIAGSFVIFCFGRTLRSILVRLILYHESTFC